MPESTPLNAIETLRKRLRTRLAAVLSLGRAYRFVSELEPLAGDGPDPFGEAEAVLRAWRRALQQRDVEAVLDAVERSWPLLEACRQRVVAHDASIEAYRVRWACENAPLHPKTIDSLARFYRLLPVSTSSQSKYEYVLTRRLAGPIGPERKIAPTDDLLDAVSALETSWSAPPLAADDGEVETMKRTLQFFAQEAANKEDAASFTTSALLRRFGSFKVSLGQNLFDPRVSVAVVEANVKVLNVLNNLLADAGGQPLRGTASARAMRPVTGAKKAPAAAPVSSPGPAGSASDDGGRDSPAPSPAPEAGGVTPRDHPNLRTGEVDISALEFLRSLLRRGTGEEKADQGVGGPPPPPAPSSLEDLLPPGESAEAPRPPDAEASEPPPVVARRPDLKTGEVDLSGLEFVRRHRMKGAASAEAAGKDETEESGRDQDSVEAAAASAAGPAGEPSAAEDEAAHLAEVEQQPSMRAFELGKLEENTAIIDRYLTGPRSAEVWQLDLDVFLGRTQSGALASEASAADRRRALELILASDDLICARVTQEGAPSAEHRAQVRAVANAMLMLRTSLRRSADLVQGRSGEIEPLLYVADHLLWERLRLEASLKRKPGRPRALLLPRTNQADKAALDHARLRTRQRRILVRVVGVAAALTTLAGLLSVAQTRQPVDRGVTLVQVSGLPGAGVFDDARAYRTTLFVTVSRTWVLLGVEERRSIMRALGAFAAERGLDTVSVIGPQGEPWATFKEDEVILDGELTPADLVRR
jgi:hypothetical protein